MNRFNHTSIMSLTISTTALWEIYQTTFMAHQPFVVSTSSNEEEHAHEHNQSHSRKYHDMINQVIRQFPVTYRSAMRQVDDFLILLETRGVGWIGTDFDLL